MSGWRAKIGVISVVSDSFEEYIHDRSPEGVSFISTKIPVRYTSKDIATAFRAYADYNIDRILFTGKESKEELEDIFKSEEIDIASDTIITKNEILGSVFASESNREKILLITPYEEQDDISDAGWISENCKVDRRSIPLLGVVDEGLRLDDATDYWKYHRVADVLSSVQNEVFDAVYIEDIELGITGMIGQLREAYGRQILCTQEILLDETLKACGIGSGRGGYHAEL